MTNDTLTLIARLNTYMRSSKMGISTRRVFGWVWTAFFLITVIAGSEIALSVGALVVAQIHFAAADVIAALKAKGEG